MNCGADARDLSHGRFQDASRPHWEFRGPDSRGKGPIRADACTRPEGYRGLIGSCVAIAAAWEGGLDRPRARAILDGIVPVEADS